jgi:hypothetical protein
VRFDSPLRRQRRQFFYLAFRTVSDADEIGGSGIVSTSAGVDVADRERVRSRDVGVVEPGRRRNRRRADNSVALDKDAVEVAAGDFCVGSSSGVGEIYVVAKSIGAASVGDVRQTGNHEEDFLDCFGLHRVVVKVYDFILCYSLDTTTKEI